MSDVEWLAVIMSGSLLIALGWQWYRRRRAAKSADELLADVLKSKDAFHR
ncbi:MAG: hypothetical protein Q8L77_15680 [Nitrospirota bacterium]|nr:hypothetical protein [Nitrospirota bacterium]